MVAGGRRATTITILLACHTPQRPGKVIFQTRRDARKLWSIVASPVHDRTNDKTRVVAADRLCLSVCPSPSLSHTLSLLSRHNIIFSLARRRQLLPNLNSQLHRTIKRKQIARNLNIFSPPSTEYNRPNYYHITAVGTSLILAQRFRHSLANRHSCLTPTKNEDTVTLMDQLRKVWSISRLFPAVSVNRNIVGYNKQVLITAVVIVSVTYC